MIVPARRNMTSISWSVASGSSRDKYSDTIGRIIVSLDIAGARIVDTARGNVVAVLFVVLPMCPLRRGYDYDPRTASSFVGK